MYRRWGSLFAFVSLCVSGCTSGAEEAAPRPTTEPTAFSGDSQRRVPPGNLLPRRSGTGTQALGEIRVDEPAALVFRCTLGSGARIRYGSGFQECPRSGALLTIDFEDRRGVIRLSVEADPAAQWEVSVGTNEIDPLPSPRSS